MIRFPLRRLALTVLGALHFIAAPCVMAMAVAVAEEPCEHCPRGGDAMPCQASSAGGAASEAAPAPVRIRPVPLAASETLLPPPVVVVAISPDRASPARRVAFATGRHTGDPPLSVLYQKFLN